MFQTKKKRRCSEIELEEKEDDEHIFSHGRDVYFHASISRKNISLMIQAIHKANQMAIQGGFDEVRLFIHSEGGDAYAGLSGMNHIEKNSVPITTVADGFVASAATFLLLGGKRRVGMEHCEILIHQLQTGFWGKYQDMIDEMQNSHRLMNTIVRMYRNKTNMKKKSLEKILSKELTMTCQEAIANGVLESLY